MVKNKAAFLFIAGLASILLACLFSAPYLMILGVLLLIAAAVVDSSGVNKYVVKDDDTVPSYSYSYRNPYYDMLE